MRIHFIQIVLISLTLVGTTLIISSTIPKEYLPIVGICFYIGIPVIIALSWKKTHTQEKDSPSITTPLPKEQKCGTRAHLHQDTIFITPLLTDKGENHVHITPRGTWELEVFPLYTRSDYERLYPRGRAWKLKAATMLDILNRELPGSSVSSELYQIIHYAAMSRKLHKSEDVDNALLVLDAIISEMEFPYSAGGLVVDSSGSVDGDSTTRA